MKVSALIKILQQCPPDLEVTLKGAGYNYGKLSADKVTGARITKFKNAPAVVELSLRRRHGNPGGH